MGVKGGRWRRTGVTVALGDVLKSLGSYRTQWEHCIWRSHGNVRTTEGSPWLQSAAWMVAQGRKASVLNFVMGGRKTPG